MLQPAVGQIYTITNVGTLIYETQTSIHPDDDRHIPGAAVTEVAGRTLAAEPARR